jgi:hypothetical protein
MVGTITDQSGNPERRPATTDPTMLAPSGDRSSSRAPLLAIVLVVVFLAAGGAVAARHFGWFDRKVQAVVVNDGCSSIGTAIDGQPWTLDTNAQSWPSSWPQPEGLSKPARVTGTARIHDDTALFTADIGGSIELTTRVRPVGCAGR